MGNRLFSVFLFTIAIVISSPILYGQASSDKIKLQPTDITVLLLPAVDDTGDNPAKVKEHVRLMNHRLEYEMLSRGFKVLPLNTAIDVATASGISLDSSSDQFQASCDKAARTANADWVVCMALVDVQEPHETFARSDRHAKAKVRIRVYDARNRIWLANKYFQSLKSDHNFFGSTDSLFRIAIDANTQRAIVEVVGVYPQTSKPGKEMGDDDLIPASSIHVDGTTPPAETGLAIITIPCQVRVETQDGSVFTGNATKFEDGLYVIETRYGVVRVRKGDLKTVEYRK